jgi:hypothetical protein
MIVALIALVIALGGTAYAVGNSINGAQLKNRSVAAKKIKKHTLTGTEINLAELGTVPNAANAATAATAAQATHATSADNLAGVGLAGLVQGGGHRTFARMVMTASAAAPFQELLTVPGLIDATVSCDSSTNPATVTFNVKNLTGAGLDVVRTTLIAPPPSQFVSTDGFTVATDGNMGGSVATPATVTLQIGSGSGATAKLDVVDMWFNTDATTCRANIESDFSG